MIEGAGVVVGPEPLAVAEGVAGVLGTPGRYAELQARTVPNASRYTLEAWVAEIDRRLTVAWGPLRRAAALAVGR
jgi:hypothetical protein